MNPTEQELQKVLTDFLRPAKERQGDVAAILKRIDELQERLGPDTHPMLRHYLERRSYQKALEFLRTGQPETEKPQCGK